MVAVHLQELRGPKEIWARDLLWASDRQCAAHLEVTGDVIPSHISKIACALAGFI